MTCFVSGVLLDDGHPLHQARIRTHRGREVRVCLAVAHLIDTGARTEDVDRFGRTMLQRETAEKAPVPGQRS